MNAKTIRSTVLLSLGFLLDLGAQHTCAACTRPRPRRAAFCEDCESRLVPYEGHRQLAGVTVLAPFAYSEPISTAIGQLKYHGRSELARLLAPYLTKTLLGSELGGPARAAVVPVPLHPERLVARGYNQSALLGRAVARKLNSACLPMALQRTRATESQAQLAGRNRTTNVSGAFLARGARRLRETPVVLLDDVITTGSTCLACLEALRRAGANVIAVASLAVRDVSSRP